MARNYVARKNISKWVNEIETLYSFSVKQGFRAHTLTAPKKAAKIALKKGGKLYIYDKEGELQLHGGIEVHEGFWYEVLFKQLPAGINGS